MKNIIYLITLFSLFTISCNKDDDTTPEPTISELLVSGKWFLSSVQDVASNSCERQSYYHFTDSYSLIVDFYGVNTSSGICESTGFSGYTYTISSRNEIVIESGTSLVIYKISAISRTNLNLTRELPSGEMLSLQFTK